MCLRGGQQGRGFEHLFLLGLLAAATAFVLAQHGCLLRSVVSAVAANMMLAKCNSDVPISLACSIWIGNRPDHGIIGTASLGDLEGLRSGRQRFGVQVIRPHRALRCRTGRGYRQPISCEGLRRCAVPMRPSRASILGGGRPVQPMF